MEQILEPLKFGQDGKLDWDTKAGLAIDAMPPGAESEKAELLERHYRTWQHGRLAGLVGRIARKPLTILRSEVELLASTVTKLMIDGKADAIREDLYKQHQRLTGDIPAFRTFLLDNYPREVREANNNNVPLLEVTRQLLVRRELAARCLAERLGADEL